MTSQNGDRVLVERLVTPRPPPKVTLKSFWQIQQQQKQQPQQPKLEDDTQSLWKQRATQESRAGVRDDTKHATKRRATRQLVLRTSEATGDAHLTVKKELTDTYTKEPLKESKLVRTKFVFKKTLFSKESRQATFNMGNVELIELRKTTIQCPSCLHYVFEGAFLCNCVKLLKLEETITCTLDLATYYQCKTKSSHEKEKSLSRFLGPSHKPKVVNTDKSIDGIWESV